MEFLDSSLNQIVFLKKDRCRFLSKLVLSRSLVCGMKFDGRRGQKRNFRLNLPRRDILLILKVDLRGRIGTFVEPFCHFSPFLEEFRDDFSILVNFGNFGYLWWF